VPWSISCITCNKAGLNRYPIPIKRDCYIGSKLSRKRLKINKVNTVFSVEKDGISDPTLFREGQNEIVCILLDDISLFNISRYLGEDDHV